MYILKGARLKKFFDFPKIRYCVTCNIVTWADLIKCNTCVWVIKQIWVSKNVDCIFGIVNHLQDHCSDDQHILSLFSHMTDHAIWHSLHIGCCDFYTCILYIPTFCAIQTESLNMMSISSFMHTYKKTGIQSIWINNVVGSDYKARRGSTEEQTETVTSQKLKMYKKVVQNMIYWLFQ